MGLAELKADATLVRERLAKLDLSKIDIKSELCDNVLPLFEGLIDAIGEEVLEPQADMEEALDELIDQATDVLHPETAAKLMGVVEYGKLLAAELEQLMPTLDDDSKKRVRVLVKTYRQGAEVIGELIADITVPDDEGDPAEPDADADPDELEPLPEETPPPVAAKKKGDK